MRRKRRRRVLRALAHLVLALAFTGAYVYYTIRARMARLSRPSRARRALA